VSHPRLAVFARQANGQVAPLRVLEGQKTGISRSLHGIYVDIPNDEIVIPSNVAGAILVFGRTQSGNTPPRRIIQGSLTHLYSPQGVAVDDKHNELVVSNDTRLSVLVFDRLANGNVAPLREIIGPKTGITNPQGIVVDPVHDEIIVSDEGKAKANPPIPAALRVFRRTDTGDVAPLRVISGPDTGMLRPRQIQLDPERDELVIADRGLVQEFQYDTPGFLAVWNRTDSGNVAPKKLIRGPRSQLTSPRSVYVDPKNGEYGAGDTNSHSIMVFPRDFPTGPKPSG
jgi:DNA-binding beta-propeller fold protein YncE